MKKALLFVSTLVIFSSFVFCMSERPREKSKPQMIKVGAILPLTGDGAIYSSPLKKGIDLAVKRIHSKTGEKVEVIYEDNQLDPKVAVAAINKLINVDKVKVILGGMFSSTTLAIAPIAQKEKVVLISPTASSEEVPNTGDYVFSIYPSDAYDGWVIANFSAEKLNKKIAFSLFVQAEAMIAGKNAFKKELIKLGGKVIGEEGFAPNTSDFRSILTKVKSLEPDLVFLAAYLNELSKILVQAKELGVNTQFITISTAFDPKLFDLAGNATEGMLLSAPFFDPSSNFPQIVDFQKSYEREYDEKPNVWAAYGYDVMQIAWLGIYNSQKNHISIDKALLNIKNYPGITGKTTFRSNGSVAKELRIMIAEDGEFVNYK